MHLIPRFARVKVHGPAFLTDQRWQYTFTEQCLSPILELVVSTNPPPYTEVLLWDARVRDFELPPPPTAGPPSGNGMCLMQMWAAMTREVGA